MLWTTVQYLKYAWTEAFSISSHQLPCLQGTVYAQSRWNMWGWDGCNLLRPNLHKKDPNSILKQARQWLSKVSGDISIWWTESGGCQNLVGTSPHAHRRVWIVSTIFKKNTISDEKNFEALLFLLCVNFVLFTALISASSNKHSLLVSIVN